jgi:orotidine-5'-phosphate decarboxylase
MNFFDQLTARSREVDSLVCVGLDPDFRRHQPSEVGDYNRAIIEATLPFAACYKPNMAFYEQWGVEGLRQLERTLAAIPADVPVIGDGKRGDLANTAEAYARAMFEAWGFGAVTVNAYQGYDAVAPFLAYEGRGVYVLCRTSNPSSTEFQARAMESGRPLYEEVAVTATAWSPRIGLVVGATASQELRRVRALAPQASILVPGVGAQGGEPREVIAAAGGAPGSIVVSSSRAIMYASEGRAAPEAAAEAARALRDELAEAAIAPP